MPHRTASIASAAAALALAALLGACASSEKPEKKPAATPPPAAPAPKTIVVVNTICPIAGDDFARNEIPTRLAREWRGTLIGFCCENCPPKFDKMSIAQKDEVRALALANAAPQNPE